MQLTRAADYAIRVMIHLAEQPERTRASLPELSKATGAPSSFLSKVLQALCNAEMVSSKRGQQGGFQLQPAGRAASIRQVVEAIEGPICLNLCLRHGKSCGRKASCVAHPVWAKAQQAVLEVLDSATVGSLALEGASRQVPFPGAADFSSLN